MGKSRDLTNKKFGKLTALKKTNKRSHSYVLWKCICECGESTLSTAASLRKGEATSCGCGRRLEFGESCRNSLIASYKHGAKKRNLKWALSNKFAIKLFEQPCYCCGIKKYSKLSHARNYGSYEYNGIDRINNKKGYTLKNVRTMCIICNRAKHSLTEKEFQEWMKRVRTFNANE